MPPTLKELGRARALEDLELEHPDKWLRRAARQYRRGKYRAAAAAAGIASSLMFRAAVDQFEDQVETPEAWGC